MNKNIRKDLSSLYEKLYRAEHDKWEIHEIDLIFENYMPSQMLLDELKMSIPEGPITSDAQILIDMLYEMIVFGKA